MGDFNWITPDFLAFASPQYEPIAPIPQNSPEFAALPSSISEVYSSALPVPFKNVLAHFTSRNIGLVVRLNSELYSPSYFTALGINHIDMIFEDGTCPPLPLVRRFIKLAHDMIAKKKGIAVHCKAGLGRTGCLIGAYLIYRYGFTANEIIAFMRFMRPGMVVGPQQHWLHLNQGAFREWWFEDTVREKLMMSMPATPGRVSSKHRLNVNGQTATPPNGQHSKRQALGEIDNNEASPCYADENLPAPTPGQPRKGHRKDTRHHPYARAASGTLGVESDMGSQSMRTKLKNAQRRVADKTEGQEDRRAMASAVSPRTPGRSPSHRSISSSLAVTPNIHEDVENWVDAASKTRSPSQTKSGSGVLGVGKVRSSPRRLGERSEGKVRKASGRIGSAGTPRVRAS